MRRKTVLIGLDGATFTVLDPLMEQGVMPFLKKWSSSGARCLLNSTPNPLTPPAWISMVTGRTPGHHSIFDFLRPVERDTGVMLKLNDSKEIKCETIWSIAGRQGRRIASLNFYGMNPAQPVSGYLVSGFIPWKHLKRATYPPEFYETIKALPGINIKDLGFHLEQEKKCFQGTVMTHQESLDWISSHIRRERQWYTILTHIMLNDPCDLTAVVFDGVDKIQHLFWPYIFPEFANNLDDKGKELRAKCMEYFRQLDTYIEGIVSMAGPEAMVFMASDHGFGTTEEIFYLNKWLYDEGYLNWSEPNKFADPGKLTEDRISSHTGIFDYKNTLAYAWTPSSNGIYIRVAEDGKNGVSPQEYGALREKIRQGLLDYRDPATGRQVVKYVYTREEAFPGEYTNLAPDLTVIMHDGGMISILNSEEVLRPRPEPAGCHRLEGIFIAGGDGVRKGGSSDAIEMTDVAPCLLHAMGLPVPEDLEGRFPEELFEDKFISANPVASGEPTRRVAFAGTSEEDAESQAVMSQLRMLGYIE